jgi:hypothetical protein
MSFKELVRQVPGESLFIPETDQQTQKQPCASYLNADTELFLARHCELHAYDDIDCPSSSAQMLDTKWLFDLNKNSSTHMIEHFRTAFISAALKPSELVYCNPPCGVDLGLVSKGLPSVWKLQASLESTYIATMCWTQSSSIHIQSFGFVSIGSGGAFWMYHHPLDDMLLCTYVNGFLLAASSLCFAQRFHHHYSLHYDCKFFIAGTHVGMDIIQDLDASNLYLSQATLINCLLEKKLGGIMCSEQLTSNGFQYNPGKDLHKWEQLCPSSTSFDYKMPKLLFVDSPEIPGPTLVHWMQVAVGTLMYTLNSCPDLTHCLSCGLFHSLSRSCSCQGT